MIILRATYKIGPNDRFDEAYFLNKHLPLARDVLAPHYTASRALRGLAPDGETPGERLIVEFEFPSEEVLKRAVSSPRMAELAQDTPKYSDKRPETLFLNYQKP